MKYFFKFFLVLLIISCDDSSECCDNPLGREQVIINKGIYIVSYNEVYEQPNWIEYSVSNRPKNVDRGNKDFYLEPGVKTSDNADYYKNDWDKGHLAPAATFSDSEINLKSGFKFGYKNLILNIQYTFLSSQFTDASNAVNSGLSGLIGEIPSYEILDFSASYFFDKFKIETGLNNLLNSRYFTRRATGYPGPGIIPSEPRSVYLTIQFKN